MLALEQEGKPLAFRYSLTCKPKVNVFKPKPLVNPGLDLRTTVFGAVLLGSLKEFQPPKLQNLQILWEAILFLVLLFFVCVRLLGCPML